jgi:hypothetical protein
MMHLAEEELIGQAYGEAAPQVMQHLESCAECARTYAELQSDLAELSAIEPPHRDPFYGEQVWQSISPALASSAQPRRSQPRQRWFAAPLALRLGYAAVCAALVAGAFYAGRRWEHNGKQPPVTATNNQPKPRQPIVVVVLGDHLDRSERLLVELKHVDASNTAMMPPLRDEARSLLAANHVCRQNAEKTGDPALEGALDHLDHLLAEMANQPGGLNSAAITRLQDEMTTEGLLFEVRVLRSRARDQKPGVRDHSAGGEI